MSSALPPFSCTYTPNLPELLTGLGCSLVISTYQAGKVILLSATPTGLVQLPRNFDKPMGLAFNGNRNDCDEIYDVQVLPGLRRPGIMGLDTPLHRSALSTPLYGFWSQPER